MDLSFGVSNLDEGKTITKLYIGDTEIAKSSGANWSVSGGNTVVLKKAYLATLDVGEIVFTAKMTDGLTVTFTVTVTDSSAPVVGLGQAGSAVLTS